MIKMQMFIAVFIGLIGAQLKEYHYYSTFYLTPTLIIGAIIILVLTEVYRSYTYDGSWLRCHGKIPVFKKVHVKLNDGKILWNVFSDELCWSKKTTNIYSYIQAH
jgi:hypothetical protein